MKFYQIIAPMILSIMYTVTIFGAQKITFPEVSEDVCGLIDEFCDRKEKNTFYKQTGHIKPYSRLLDLFSYLQPGRTSLLNSTFTIASSGFVFALFNKIFPMRTPTTNILSCCVISGITLIAFHIIFTQLSNSYLIIKSPTKVTILDDKEIITANAFTMETRSLSDLRITSNLERLEYLNFKSNSEVETNCGLSHQLIAGTIYIYPDDENKYTPKDQLSLPTQATVTNFTVYRPLKSIRPGYYKVLNNRMVTVGEDGLYKWKLHERKSLYKIMKTLQRRSIGPFTD